MASAAPPPPPPPAPLLTMLVALLLCAAVPAPANAAPAPAAASAPGDVTADALEALGAAPALLARLHAWDAAAPPVPVSAPGPALFFAAPDDLDAQEAAAAEAAAAAAAAAVAAEAYSREVPRVKRSSAQSLSIVAPLDVLRQRLMNELNRRRMRELQGSRIQQNRQLLSSIGKRMANRLPVDLWSSWEERLAAQQA